LTFSGYDKGKKMKIVRINGFRIPGLEYRSKPLPGLEFKNEDAGLAVRYGFSMHRPPGRGSGRAGA